MRIEPYLFFEGRCEEALDFYHKALGAEVQELTHYEDSPAPTSPGHGRKGKVMHASVRVGESTVFASDGRCTGQSVFQGFALSLTIREELEAERLFAALADGGKIKVPLAKTFFSPRYGMVTDRFGVLWIVYVATAE